MWYLILIIPLETFSENLRTKIGTLRHNPINPQNMVSLVDDGEFGILWGELLTYNDYHSQMITSYMQDVSHLLSLVHAVREKCIMLHMQAKRALLPQVFSFKQAHYARFFTRQNVMLKTLPQRNPSAWQELLDKSCSGSLSGEPFSTEHGDHITETTINREVKVRGGPMRVRYSTDFKAHSNFDKTSHLRARVRSAMKE